MGSDDDGWTYWYFGDQRLYREVPIPNGQRGVNMMNSTDFTFQLVCSTVEGWHDTMKKITKPMKLADAISEVGLKSIAIFESREYTRQSKIKKLQRAKELESVPKKRSSRLEAKVKIDRIWVYIFTHCQSLKREPKDRRYWIWRDRKRKLKNTNECKD